MPVWSLTFWGCGWHCSIPDLWSWYDTDAWSLILVRYGHRFDTSLLTLISVDFVWCQILISVACWFFWSAPPRNRDFPDLVVNSQTIFVVNRTLVKNLSLYRTFHSNNVYRCFQHSSVNWIGNWRTKFYLFFFGEVSFLVFSFLSSSLFYEHQKLVFLEALKKKWLKMTEQYFQTIKKKKNYTHGNSY